MLKGTRVGAAYVDLVINGDGINEEIVHSVDEAGPGVEKTGEEHGDRYGKKFDESFFDRMRKFIPGMRRQLNKDMEASGTDAGNRAGQRITGSMEHYMDDKFGAHIADTFADSFVRRLEERLAGNGGSTLSALLSRAVMDGLDASTVSGNGDRRGVGSGATRSLGDKVGNIFGSGSRNNAIIPFQLTAKAAGGIINALSKAKDAAGGFFSTMQKGGSEAVDITEQLTVNTSEFAGMIGKGLSSLAAGGVVIGVVAAAASVLVSVLSALVGIVAALASTVLSALVGAAAVGATALLALGAAAGLAVIAFTSLTDAQRKVLTTSFKPIKDELAGLGQLMLKDIVPAFHQWSVNIQQALGLLIPLSQVMGRAFANAGSIFTAALSGPGFQQFTRALTIFLPSIVTNMTKALGGFLNGLLSMFSAVLPDVAQFARYLADVAARFQRWTASAQGQNAIDSFVQRALVSLRSLWGFLKQVGGLLADVLFSSSGQNAGNSIFDDMANAIKHFRSTITQAKLEKWFKDATTLAKGLGQAIKGLMTIFNQLNSSGVINAVSDSLKGLSKVADVSKFLVNHTINLKTLGGAFNFVKNAITGTGDSSSTASGQVGVFTRSLTGLASMMPPAIQNFNDIANAALGLPGPLFGATQAVLTFAQKAQLAASAAITAFNPLVGLMGMLGALNGGATPSVAQVQASGSNALANTSKNHGGTKPPKGPAQFHNPFLGIANAILNSGPSISSQIKNAMITVNKQVQSALASISTASDVRSANSGINSLVQSVTASMQQAVNTARDAVQSAAQSLASASNIKQARRALAELRARQRDLAAALKDQRLLKQQIALLQGQRTQHASLTDAFKDLVGDGDFAGAAAIFKASNLTLADFAKMRSFLADQIQKANQKLSEAIALRDNYQSQVSDSIKAFGALTTAQAQVINGVQQALSSNDIINNLQDKLTQIQKFQSNLNLLLAMGLSNDAYKQIVDAGVEAGSAYAQALVDGGTGAIGQVNSLVQSTNDIADKLGLQASNRLYQAGVDAAQGLVDGLTSLSGQLDAAATALGTRIATAVKNALGIKSPSRVMMAMMGYVGDGIALGLDEQGAKVALAAGRLSSQIAISPEVAAYAAGQATPATVSGNQHYHEWNITTPTEDPKTVAAEMMNEMIARI